MINLNDCSFWHYAITLTHWVLKLTTPIMDYFNNKNALIFRRLLQWWHWIPGLGFCSDGVVRTFLFRCVFYYYLWSDSDRSIYFLCFFFQHEGSCCPLVSSIVLEMICYVLWWRPYWKSDQHTTQCMLGTDHLTCKRGRGGYIFFSFRNFFIGQHES